MSYSKNINFTPTSSAFRELAWCLLTSCGRVRKRECSGVYEEHSRRRAEFLIKSPHRYRAPRRDGPRLSIPPEGRGFRDRRKEEMNTLEMKMSEKKSSRNMADPWVRSYQD
ncbi:uncharacterized [Tachysurus ichikawai]